MSLSSARRFDCARAERSGNALDRIELRESKVRRKLFRLPEAVVCSFASAWRHSVTQSLICRRISRASFKTGARFVPLCSWDFGGRCASCACKSAQVFVQIRIKSSAAVCCVRLACSQASRRPFRRALGGQFKCDCSDAEAHRNRGLSRRRNAPKTSREEKER